MAVDMGRMLGASAGDRAAWPGGFAQQPVRPVTDLSPHVDGGDSQVSGTNATASGDEQRQMYICAGIVLGALFLLWLLGAVVFRRIKL